MSFIGFIIFGLIVGALARLLVPGPQKMGWIATLVLGVVGAVLGGGLAQALNISTTQQDPVSFFMALLGAVVVLVIVQVARNRRV